jgi:hypothetical protein
MVRGASAAWSRDCGISFMPWKHFVKDASADQVPYRADGDADIRVLKYKYSHLNYITAVFSPSLKHNGDTDSQGGIADYPQSDRKAITMAWPSSSIFAHELGHYLNLPHVADDPWPETRDNDPYNLMFPGDFGDEIVRNFAPVQCAEAKRYILGFSHLRELCRPDASDPELSKSNCPDLVL